MSGEKHSTYTSGKQERENNEKQAKAARGHQKATGRQAGRQTQA
jgi:hypothetical protein